MRVPNIDHDAGISTGQARAAVSSKLAHPAAPSISLTRLAWFDANGDGRIDTRAAGSGGDATLLVPTHEVDLPTYGHNANPRIDTRAVKASDAAPMSPAQTQRAVDAYQRYGQTPAVSAPAASTANADATSLARA
jgi:hypothetical protein